MPPVVTASVDTPWTPERTARIARMAAHARTPWGRGSSAPLAGPAGDAEEWVAHGRTQARHELQRVPGPRGLCGAPSRVPPRRGLGDGGGFADSQQASGEPRSSPERRAGREALRRVHLGPPGPHPRDRGEKFAHYRGLPSLQEYVLVSQDEQRIEVFRRGEGAARTFIPWSEGESAELRSIGVQLDVSAMCADPTA